MKIFVTGASGFIGSSVVEELVRAGHTVTGLARSAPSSELIKKLGGTPILGSLTDLEILKKSAGDSDGIIHTGFIHDFSKFAENCKIDQTAIETMASAIRGTSKPLVVTAGLVDIDKKGPVAQEDDHLSKSAELTPRQSEQTALRLFQEHQINTRVVRLAPAVHGDGPHGFMAGFATVLIGIAKKTGKSAYIGDGSNLWTGCHRLDAGQLYRLAFEKGEGGARYHGVEKVRVSFKDLAKTIGEKLDLPVVSLSDDEAAQHFGWFTKIAQTTLIGERTQTDAKLGYKPNHLDLVADLKRATLPLETNY
ncbi:MAG: SDR family oxidoreductase [Proteobacteria bacterium]|nr:MAG: SDR family oxidoreductase [Pseudomonadota bacterium]